MIDVREILARALADYYDALVDDDYSPQWCEIADAQLAALREQGLAIVPEKSTEDMQEAGLDSPDATYCDRCMHLGKTGHHHPAGIWSVMLAAGRLDK